MLHADLKRFPFACRLLNGRDLPLALRPAHGFCWLHTSSGFCAFHTLHFLPLLCPLQVCTPPQISLQLDAALTVFLASMRLQEQPLNYGWEWLLTFFVKQAVSRCLLQARRRMCIKLGPQRNCTAQAMSVWMHVAAFILICGDVQQGLEPTHTRSILCSVGPASGCEVQ